MTAATLEAVPSAGLVFHRRFARAGFAYLSVPPGFSARVGEGPMRRREFKAMIANQHRVPVYLTNVGSSRYWQHRDTVYVDHEGLSAHQVHEFLSPRYP